MKLYIDPLPYDQLKEEMHKARVHAEKVVARWKRSKDEKDPVSHVWHELAIQHGQMYIVLESLVAYREKEGER